MSVDDLHTSSEMRMTRLTLIENRDYLGQDQIDSNSVVSEWKENFRLSQPNPSLFGGILYLVDEAANILLTISSWMFLEL